MGLHTDPTTAPIPVDRMIPARSYIPDDPAPGNYVVVDVAQFSTTVPELFANGARYIHITENRGDEPEFQQDHPRARIGGGSGTDYRGEPGYDFFNSPSFVQHIDVDDRPTAMTSTNGGNAVTDLRLAGDEDVTVYVGGFTNGAALAAPPGAARVDVLCCCRLRRKTLTRRYRGRTVYRPASLRGTSNRSPTDGLS